MLQQNLGPYWESYENRLRAGDVNVILAWIDYCVFKRLGPDAFEKSIVAHLSRGCQQRDFTFKQIDIKVRELWINSSRLNEEALSDHTVVYRIGTKALRGREFNDERVQIVKAQVQQLMNQPVPEYAKPSSQSARKKRKVEHISTGESVAKRLFRQTKRSRPNSRVHSIPSRSPRDSVSVQIHPTPSRTTAGAHARRDRLAPSAVLECEHIPTLRSPTVSEISNSIEESQSPSASRCMESPEVFLTPPRGSVQPNRTRTATPPLISSAESRSSCSLSECGTVRQLLSERERDLQDLREKISETHNTIQALQPESAARENRCTMCKNAADAPTQKNLAGYLAEIEILRSQILNKEVFVPFTTRDIKKHMPFDKKYFQNNMLDIRNEIDDFMCLCSEMSRPCNDIKLQETSDDLLGLLHRMLGESRDNLQVISFHSLLRSILSAAVCEWVLECDILEPMFTDCPLRNTMLSHLITTDSEDVARNLDLAAHHTLIESADFQDNVIPLRAEALAVRLSDTVEPLFSLQNPLERWEVDILQDWQQQRSALEKIFVSALKVKTKALVSKCVFEVIFPVPGSKYDPKHTEVERLERDNGSSELGRSPIVRLCLVPGLRTFPVDRKLVDYNSFRRLPTSSAEPEDVIIGPLVIPEC